MQRQRQSVSLQRALKDKNLVPVYVLNALYELREAAMPLCRPEILKNVKPTAHHDNLRKLLYFVLVFVHSFDFDFVY